MIHLIRLLSILQYFSSFLLFCFVSFFVFYYLSWSTTIFLYIVYNIFQVVLSINVYNMGLVGNTQCHSNGDRKFPFCVLFIIIIGIVISIIMIQRALYTLKNVSFFIFIYILQIYTKHTFHTKDIVMCRIKYIIIIITMIS